MLMREARVKPNQKAKHQTQTMFYKTLANK
jgi:hypothetical protein